MTCNSPLNLIVMFVFNSLNLTDIPLSLVLLIYSASASWSIFQNFFPESKILGNWYNDIGLCESARHSWFLLNIQDWFTVSTPWCFRFLEDCRNVNYFLFQTVLSCSFYFIIFYFSSWIWLSSLIRTLFSFHFFFLFILFS